MIDSSTLWASLLPAILLAQSATLLARANEIDLSLDQQCFFVAAFQACLFNVVSPWTAVLFSFALLALFQSGKLYFDRKTRADSMVTSISAALMYIGVTFLLIWHFRPGSQYPPYQSWISLSILSGLTIGALIVPALLIDALVGPMQRARFEIKPLGGVPGRGLSMVWSVWPAALLTCAAGSILGLHSETVTPSFSNGFGILGATCAIMAHGRLGRGAAFGFLLGLIYVVGIIAVTAIPDKVVQSFLVPISSFAIVGGTAMFIRRP